MKKYLAYFILCCVSTLVASCEQDGDNAFSVEYTPVNISPQGGEISFTIHTSGRWKAEQTASWLTLRPGTGEGDQTVTVAVAANADAELNTRLRTANIYIIAGAHTSSIAVTQLGHEQPLPGMPTITGDDANQCPLTSTVALTASPVEYAVAYAWYRNGIAIQTHTSTSYTVTESGVYSVAGVNYAGAEGAKSAGKTVIIDPCPPADAGTIIGDDFGVCNSVLTAPEIEHATIYTWYKGAQIVQTGASRSYTATESGYYSVVGSNINGTGAPSPQKQVTIRSCLDFGYGKTYRTLTCNKSILNTAAGSSMFDPFLSIYDAMYNAVAGLPRYITYISVIFNDNNQMQLRAGYTNAGGTLYSADFYYTINTEPDGTVYFTNFVTTTGNANTVGPRMASNILKYFLYSGTGNANGTTVTASGNKFKIARAPIYTPGVSLLGGFYLISDPTNYIPGILP
ncbi:MAG: BACON domain-containing protein [Prevotellaceae bacterium]|jgi:hypothetical protein|nr:BACON domain-containing protein [Prevotellaceae bacterium]